MPTPRSQYDMMQYLNDAPSPEDAEFLNLQKMRRAEALRLMNGEGVGSEADYITAETAGIPRQYSQMGASALSNLVANGAAGSGFQNRAMNTLNQNQAADTANARQRAMRDRNQALQGNRERGLALMGEVDEAQQTKRTADYTRDQFNRQDYEAQQKDPLDYAQEYGTVYGLGKKIGIWG